MVQSPPPTIVEPLKAEAVDAGVIEEARARQRRHRGVAGAATVLAAAIAAILWASVGGGGGSHPARGSVPPARPSSQGARPSLASCLAAKGNALQGAPSQSLLSSLRVLRRPGTPADALPPAIEQNFLGGEFGHDIFVHYIRRARVIAGRSYYVMPVRTGCGSIKPSEDILLACVLRSGQRIVDAGSGGETTAPQVKQGSAFLVGGSCLHTNQATLIAGIVPDSVARITLRYPSSTISAAVVNNVVAAAIPHPGGPLWRPLVMTWRAANGHIIKTFHKL